MKEHQDDAPAQLDGDRELEQFFADLSQRSARASYQGIDFEAFAVGAPSLAAALLFAWWYGLVARLGRERRGTHVKIWLPVQVAADLLLESRPAPLEGDDVDADDPLGARFAWSASSDRRVREYIKGPLLEALIEVLERCAVVVTDRFISFGPLPPEPALRAALVARVIGTLPRCAAEDTPKPSGPPYRGDATQDPGEMVVIATTAIRRQADLWRSKLDVLGIANDIYGYDRSQPWGAATPMRPIELCVYEADRARAIAMLESTVGDAAFCHNCGESAAADAKVCPECGERLIDEEDGKSVDDSD